MQSLRQLGRIRPPWVVVIASVTVCILSISVLNAIANDPAEEQLGVLASEVDLSKFLGDDPKHLAYIAPRTSQFPDTSTPGLVIGIIDSGVNSRHPQIAPFLINARSFTGGSAEDEIGHGTSVAIGALHAGPKFQIVSAKVTDSDGRVRLSSVLNALNWLDDIGVKQVNMSFGFRAGQVDVNLLCDAIEQNVDTIYVAAAGNYGPGTELYPAACPSVLSVGTEEEYSGNGEVTTAPEDAAWSISFNDYQVEQARTLLTSGKLKQAESILSSVLSDDPRHAEANFLLGYAYFSTGQTELASNYALTATSNSNDDPQHLWLSALVRANLDDRKMALNFLERLLEIDPTNNMANEFETFLMDESNILPSSLGQFFENHQVD